MNRHQDLIEKQVHRSSADIGAGNTDSALHRCNTAHWDLLVELCRNSLKKNYLPLSDALSQSRFSMYSLDLLAITWYLTCLPCRHTQMISDDLRLSQMSDQKIRVFLDFDSSAASAHPPATRLVPVTHGEMSPKAQSRLEKMLPLKPAGSSNVETTKYIKICC